jgi:hypothetical protein
VGIKLRNKGINKCLPIVVVVTQSLRWAGHVDRTGERKPRRTYVKVPAGREKCVRIIIK